MPPGKRRSETPSDSARCVRIVLLAPDAEFHRKFPLLVHSTLEPYTCLSMVFKVFAASIVIVAVGVWAWQIESQTIGRTPFETIDR